MKLTSLTTATALLATATLPLSAEDSYYADPSADYYSGKEVTGGEVLYTAPKELDLSIGFSYVHDTNTAQAPAGFEQEATIAVVDFGVDYVSGSRTSYGGFYGLSYTGQAFIYDDSAAQQGRDTFEHRFAGYLGYNTGKTRIQIDANYYRNNGNALNSNNLFRETRRAQSHDLDAGVTVVREVKRGTLEFGFGYQLRDFDAGTGLNDGERVSGDFAWYFKPVVMPKTQLGFGFNYASDDFSANSTTDMWAPSLRWRYRLSGKTSLRSSIGYQFRETSGALGSSTDNLNTDFSIVWAATANATLDLGVYRGTRTSYAITGEDFTRTGVSLRWDQALPADFKLTTSASYETADYFANNAAVAASGREDDYFKLGVTLSRPVYLTSAIRGDLSVFYNYSENDSNVFAAGFEQHVFGVRAGFVY